MPPKRADYIVIMNPDHVLVEFVRIGNSVFNKNGMLYRPFVNNNRCNDKHYTKNEVYELMNNYVPFFHNAVIRNLPFEKHDGLIKFDIIYDRPTYNALLIGEF